MDGYAYAFSHAVTDAGGDNHSASHNIAIAHAFLHAIAIADAHVDDDSYAIADAYVLADSHGVGHNVAHVGTFDYYGDGLDSYAGVAGSRAHGDGYEYALKRR